MTFGGTATPEGETYPLIELTASEWGTAAVEAEYGDVELAADRTGERDTFASWITARAELGFCDRMYAVPTPTGGYDIALRIDGSYSMDEAAVRGMLAYHADRLLTLTAAAELAPTLARQDEGRRPSEQAVADRIRRDGLVRLRIRKFTAWLVRE